MLALTTTNIAWLLFTVILAGWAVYAYLNIRASRDELGSEIELAANRKPYYDDEVLEGSRLTRVLGIGLILMVIITVALPLYWILEPSRQAGAVTAKQEQFERWGGNLFRSTAEGGFNCAGCHGGMNATGGSAAYSITDTATGDVRAVDWIAPALNTVFHRFDEDEIRYILVYGRPGTPMPAWGTEGGGPMNDQQIDTLIAYMRSIQLPRQDCDLGEDPLTCASGHLATDIQDEIDAAARRAVTDGTAASYGEALFELGMDGGAYSCARCHTQGWSWGEPGVPGQGQLGWNLTGGSTNARFANETEMIEFIKLGTTNGGRYGTASQGTGRMPGFGTMLTDEQIQAIVEYVRSL
ncbi:MAG TPA: c-type cytochrome [Ilumatobacter sp.]|nr:c-type cytochrome [Ilumatobacter sp.]